MKLRELSRSSSSRQQPHRWRLWPGLAHGAFQMSRELEPMHGYIVEIGGFLNSALQA